MKKKTLMILKNIRNPKSSYLIDAISLRWKKSGHEVFTYYGAKNLPAADIVVLHVDTTVVPDEYAECLSEYPVVLNRNVLNISKTMFSRHILREDDDYSGPVIIKTVANFGGVPEAALKRIPTKKMNGWARRLLSPRRQWESLDELNPNKYPIFENKEKIPSGVWKNDNLIVEKFLPERADGLFFLRYWIFLGQKGWSGRFGAKVPIVKFRNMATKDEPVPVPDELKILRKRLGFDYGRFDFAEHKGETVIYDVNKTLGGTYHLEAYAAHLDMLATGIDTFL